MTTKKAVNQELDEALRRMGETIPEARADEVLVIGLSYFAAKLEFHYGSSIAARALAQMATQELVHAIAETNATRN